MALDEPKDDDEVHEIDGWRVCAEKKLLDQVGGLTVDYTANAFGEGFQVREGNEPSLDCGSCSC